MPPKYDTHRPKKKYPHRHTPQELQQQEKWQSNRIAQRDSDAVRLSGLERPEEDYPGIPGIREDRQAMGLPQGIRLLGQGIRAQNQGAMGRTA